MKTTRFYTLLALLLMMGGVTMQGQVRSEMYELLPESRSIKVGDVNNDGFVDVVVSRLNSPDNEVIFSIYLNDGEGHLECHENISSSKPSLHMCYEQPQLFFLLEDFDMDGNIDIASYVYADHEGMLDDTCYFRINYNNGYGRFDRFTETALILPEVIWWNNQPYYLNNPYYLGLVSGDFNGDLFPDVAVANDYHANTISALGYAYNDGTGNFDTDFLMGSLHVPVVSDLNNDSKDDIVDGANIIYSTDSLIPRYEYLHSNVYDGYSSNGMVVFDIDGDGWKDVVEGRSDYNSHLYSHLWVFKNLRDETFQKKLDKLNKEVEKIRKNYEERRQKDKQFIVHTYVGSAEAVPQCTLFWYEEHSLLGDDRAIVSDIAGTTRDAIDTVVENQKGKFIFIDTAGIRRKSRIKDNVEKYSIIRAEAAVDRADVCVIMIDATEGFTEQDSKVAGIAHEAGKGCIIAVNKWDAIEKDGGTMNTFRKKLENDFSFMAYAPIIFISAKTGQRIDRLFELIKYVADQNATRISTGMLNDVLADATARVQPPSDKGKRLKIYYITQPSTKPPTFVCFVNNADLFHFSYQRYLENKIRETFGLEGTPVRFIVRERGESRK